MKLMKAVERLEEKLPVYYYADTVLFYGFAGTGKTRFSSHFPTIYFWQYLHSNNEWKDNMRFIIFNTDGSFQFKDLRAIAEANNVDYKSLREHIIFERVKEMEILFDKVNAVVKTIRNNNYVPVLFAIDSINEPFYYCFTTFDDKSKRLSYSLDLYSLLEEIKHKLFSLQYKYGTVVVLTARRKQLRNENMVRYWWERIYMGKALGYIPSVAIRLETLDRDTNVKTLIADKHRHFQEQVRVKVKMNEWGFDVL